MRKREQRDLVFCYNDFSAPNVIVDPETLKIAAIIDWEYAGFYPAGFESPFYRRPGPSVALEVEVSDVDALQKVLSEESM
ncbi:phosphotransferase [Candidatus Bathyarchaeota archaeon]|nr:phosphotransferase [Candidatus Bathyarchaeota archaeon]